MWGVTTEDACHSTRLEFVEKAEKQSKYAKLSIFAAGQNLHQCI